MREQPYTRLCKHFDARNLNVKGVRYPRDDVKAGTDTQCILYGWLIYTCG
jgi:hypothetical protein